MATRIQDLGTIQKAGWTLFTLALTLLVLTIAYTGTIGIVETQNANANAVSTTGTVTSTTLNSTYHPSTEERHDGGYYTYRPQVAYHYTVDGTRYDSTEFFDDYDQTDEYGRKSDARAALPDTTDVTVYYMPGNPDRSFLVHPDIQWEGTTVVSLLIFLPGFGFIAFHVWLLRSLVSDVLGTGE